jgi:hypothetical protein
MSPEFCLYKYVVLNREKLVKLDALKFLKLTSSSSELERKQNLILHPELFAK